MPTLAEIAQGRQIPLTSGILEAVATQSPALAAFDARTVRSTKFQTLALVELPNASGFKHYGEGASHGAARLELREFDAKLMVAKVEAEQITAARWDAEHLASGETYFDMQINARMAKEMRHLERTIFYGTVYDAKGFPGLKQLTPVVSANTLTLNEDPGDLDYVKSVINAAGTTATTASSVYSVKYGPMDAQIVVCNDLGGELFAMSEPIRQHLAPDATKPNETLEYLITQISGHFGVSVSGMNETPNNVVPTQYAVRRLANVTRDNNCTLNDKLLERLVSSHGDGVVPDVIFMSNRSYMDWRDSRQATNVTVFLGGGGDAVNIRGNLPRERMDFEGIRVVVTNAIRNNDAIETV
jgi:hypothetical protein